MAPAIFNSAPGPAQVEFVNTQNGRMVQGWGDMASRLIRSGGDLGHFRPWIGQDGRSYVSVRNQQTGKRETMVTNAPASLRFQDWRLIDDIIQTVAKPRLKFVGDLRAAGLEVTLPNGMAHTVYSYERMSDISAANINMSPVVKTEGDRPVNDIINMPLPLVHKDFEFDVRVLMASANNGHQPLDLTTGTEAVERVAEGIEQLALGVWPTYAFAGGTVYGLTNFTNRLTKTMTAPTAAGWTPATTVNEVLAMRTQSQQAYHFGPWRLYTSTNWDAYLDADYSSAKGDNTLRNRLQRIEGIQAVQTIDYFQFLTSAPYTMVLLEMSPKNVREVIGMEIMTVEWETHGGFMKNYKCIGMMNPQFRADMNNNCGIVHGTAASS